MVCQQLLEVLWAEDVDLCQKQLTLDKRGLGVIQDSPHWDQILELSPCLFHDSVLSGKHNGHAGEILNLGVADDQTIDVEAASGEDARDAGEHAGLILDEAVEDMTLWWCYGRRGSLVEDVGDGGLGGPCWGVLRRERSDTAVQSLVCEC